jgi:predicted metallopeptidase
MYLKLHNKSFRRSKKKRPKVEWTLASDVMERIRMLVESLKLDWIQISSLTAIRSKNSKTRAYARIWGLSKIWQLALKSSPAYIIEVISEKFDKLDSKKQDQILLHELAPHTQKFFWFSFTSL